MAKNPCDGATESSSNTSNLLSHPKNTIESVNHHGSGLGLLSNCSFIHRQSSTLPNSSTTNVISWINSVVNATNVGELNK